MRTVLLVLQALGLVACIGLVLWPQLEWSFEAATRYRGDEASDWKATNVWLESAECARESGAWLVICDQGRLVPISDRALADDPGHALVLALWALAADRSILVIDVAHLNLVINLVGLLLLAGLLLVLGSYASAVALLLLGPYVFLEWFGTSPHWAFIGLAAMQPILPLALLARWQRWVSPGMGVALILLGFLTLAFASLLREAIAQMTLVVTFGVLAWIASASWRDRHGVAGLLVLALVTVLASQAARLTVGLRDRVYTVEQAELVPTHGMAHTLYIGLGAVPNKFGIRYDDAAGQEAAARAAPTVKYLSKEYFRTMWNLYFARWADDPTEVLRIYLEKCRLILEEQDSRLPPAAMALSSAPGARSLVVQRPGRELRKRRLQQAAGDKPGERCLRRVVCRTSRSRLSYPLLRCPRRRFRDCDAGYCNRKPGSLGWASCRMASRTPIVAHGDGRNFGQLTE